MKKDILTDLEISNLIAEAKYIQNDLFQMLSKAKTKSNFGHKECDVEIQRGGWQ